MIQRLYENKVSRVNAYQSDENVRRRTVMRQIRANESCIANISAMIGTALLVVLISIILPIDTHAAV